MSDTYARTQTHPEYREQPNMQVPHDVLRNNLYDLLMLVQYAAAAFGTNFNLFAVQCSSSLHIILYGPGDSLGAQ